jgi:hypothetical protein
VRAAHLLTAELAAELVAEVWCAAEFPEAALDQEEWLSLFALAGYTVNGASADLPPSPLRLYRGASARPPGRYVVDVVAGKGRVVRQPLHVLGATYRVDRASGAVAAARPDRLPATNRSTS